MSKQKLTPWFPASVKPVREGVYEVRSPMWGTDETCHSYWNGEFFNYISSAHERSIGIAFDERHLSGAGDTVTQWRGLKEQA